MKKKLKFLKPLTAIFIFISIISLSTTVTACGRNRIFFMAYGEDLDLTGFNNLIIGSVKGHKGEVMFYSGVHDESGEYEMLGMLEKGKLKTTEHMFYCPVLNAWWINVWWIEGEGLFRTTDTNREVIFRNSIPNFIMPNTEGHYVSATIFMWLTVTKEYYPAEFDELGNLLDPPLDEDPLIWEEGRWVLAGVFWDTGIPQDFGFGIGILPIGPVSYLTRYIKF